MHLLDDIQRELRELRERVSALTVESSEALQTARFAGAIAFAAAVAAGVLLWDRFF